MFDNPLAHAQDPAQGAGSFESGSGALGAAQGQTGAGMGAAPVSEEAGTAGGGAGGGSDLPGGPTANTGGGAGAGGDGTVAQLFSHFAQDAQKAGAASQQGDEGGGGPASLEATEAQSKDAPPHAKQGKEGAQDGGEQEGDTQGGGGEGEGADAAPVDEDGLDGKDTAEQQVSELPADIAGMFPDADLRGVRVHLNSQQAAKRGVDGFANADEIHVAPGAQVSETLRHEAAHVVQFRNGKKQVGEGSAKADSEEQNEKKAKKAESGGQHMAADLGKATPGQVRFKGGTTGPKAESTNLSDKGVPKVTFNGTQFKSVSGNFVGELAKASWPKKTLFEKEQWWRIPAFPVGGLYVQASAVFTPTAKLSWKGSYTYEKGAGNAPGKFKVGASLDGELSAGITGTLGGGAGLNAVIQRGGVGLEAALTAQAYGKVSRSLSFWVGADGKSTGLDLTALDIDFGAVIKGALNAVVWTKGWFADKKKTWTLADTTIATLAQYKAQLGVNMSSNKGIKPVLGGVQGGRFTWGEAPKLQ